MTTDSEVESKQRTQLVAVTDLPGSRLLSLAYALRRPFADHEKGPNGLQLDMNEGHERTRHAPWSAEERQTPKAWKEADSERSRA